MKISDDEYNWYYKSNLSEKWWKYDVNSNSEIENAFSLFNDDAIKNPSFKLLIAGNVYIIDFEQNVQIRSDNRALRRKIKREKLLKADELAGVAGLKIDKKDKKKNSLSDLTESLTKLDI